MPASTTVQIRLWSAVLFAVSFLNDETRQTVGAVDAKETTVNEKRKPPAEWAMQAAAIGNDTHIQRVELARALEIAAEKGALLALKRHLLMREHFQRVLDALSGLADAELGLADDETQDSDSGEERVLTGGPQPCGVCGKSIPEGNRATVPYEMVWCVECTRGRKLASTDEILVLVKAMYDAHEFSAAGNQGLPLSWMDDIKVADRIRERAENMGLKPVTSCVCGTKLLEAGLCYNDGEFIECYDCGRNYVIELDHDCKPSLVQIG